MRGLAACIMISLLAGSYAAHGQANPASNQPRAPSDRTISGLFSPARVEADQEAAAKKAQESGTKPFERGRNYYFLWSSMSPPEFEALGRNVLFLIAVWTQKSGDLPIKRVYIRADGQEQQLQKVAGWNTFVDGNTLTAKMYGANREDGFYLVSGSALLRKGQIVLDLPNRPGWVIMELPSNVATKDSQRFLNLDSVPNSKPNLKVLQELIQRRFSGFMVPQSLP